MQADFDDVRLADDAEAPLPYWIEDSLLVVDADIWVRVPAVPADGGSVTLYVYYGNPTVDTTSDGEATFPFFDDFEGPVLDATKWTATGSYSLVGGALRVETGVVHSSDLVVPGPGFVGEFQRGALEGAIAEEDASLAVCATTEPFVGGFPCAQNRLLGQPDAFVYDGAIQTIYSDWTFQNTGILETFAIGVSNGMVRYDRDRGASTFDVDDEWNNPMVMWMGQVNGTLGGVVADIPDLDIHFALVRNYPSVAPLVLIGPEEAL